MKKQLKKFEQKAQPINAEEAKLLKGGNNTPDTAPPVNGWEDIIDL